MDRRPLVALAAAAIALTGAAPARAAAPYADAVLPTPSLAAYWAFNETLGPLTADLRTTANAEHFGKVAAGTAPLVSGGHSARYDGRDAATIAANSRRLNPARALTLEAWVQPATLPRAATIVRKSGQYALRATPDGRAGFRVHVGGRTAEVFSPPGTLLAGRTVHLAGTYDGVRLRLLVDASESGARPASGQLDKAARPVVIGEGFRGRIDDVAIYGAALDEGALAAHGVAAREPACPTRAMRIGLGTWRPPCWRPYLDGGPFNQPLRPGVPDAPASGAMVARMLGLGSPKMIYGLPGATSDPAYDPGDFGHPIYSASWTDRRSPVTCLKVPCPEMRRTRVPVPSGARPAQAGDGHLGVIDDAAGVEWGLWQVGGDADRVLSRVVADGRRLRVGGAGRTSQREGLDYGLRSDATAAHFGLAAGVIRAPELIAGEINHALFLLVDCTRGFVEPANGLGAECPRGARRATAIGQRLRLDYSDAEIDALDAPAWKKAVLRAMARYGAYVGDTGANADQAFDIAIESGETYTSFGLPDYVGEFWKQVDNETQYRNYRYFDIASGVDWSRLRVVDPCVAARRC